jgi:DNA-binding XRE family transcriptional regulator
MKVFEIIRRKLGKTQSDIANAVSKPRQSIAKCEDRESDFALKLLAEMLEMPGAMSADEAMRLIRKMPWPPPKPGPKRKAKNRQGVK